MAEARSIGQVRGRLAAAVLAAAAGVSAVLPSPALAQGAAPKAPARQPVTHPEMNIDAAFARADAAVAAIVKVPDDKRTFENTLGAIDDLLATLENDTTLVQFMGNVHPDAAVRDAGSKAEERYNNFLIELGKREDLYNAVMAYAKTNPKLEGEQARFLKFTLRDFRRAGMELPREERAKLTEVQKEVNKLSIEFAKNIAEDQSSVYLTKDELLGMSEEFLSGLKQSNGMYILGLDSPTYMPVMENCDVERTRQKMWLAHKRRAGEKNVAVLEKALKLRTQAARMLGYPSVSAYEAEVRMAKDEKTIREFYEKLRPLARKKAEKDFAEFTAAKREHTGDPKAEMMPWDNFFYESYLLKTKYAVDSQKVREYFPMEQVIKGLFSITQSLYGLEYKDVTWTRGGTTDRPLWHEDVRLYEVWDKQTGKMLGEFYIDLYPRENKYNHAACWGLQNHKVWSGGKETRPLAALVCNFNRPTADSPGLQSQKDEVVTFFHEFGHCLHVIVSEAKMNRFSGTNVELDFVEAPSQMFEDWCWDPAVLATFAKHYKTGQVIPKDLVNAMVAAKNVGSGLRAETQFYYGLTDQAYETTADGVINTTQVAKELFPQVTMYKTVPDNTYYQASFGHLINYSAGYYGYMWSLVYASDMSKRFKELGMLSPEAGMYYRKKIISQGGTRDAMDLIKDYLGREPQLDSFLEQLGLTPESTKN